MNDQANRLYALNLLNRANADFNQHDVALVAAIIPLLESDVGDMIDGMVGQPDTIGTLGGMKLHLASTKLATGLHRPGTACETRPALAAVPAAPEGRDTSSSTTERTMS